jgi:hypothetical protein
MGKKATIQFTDVPYTQDSFGLTMSGASASFEINGPWDSSYLIPGYTKEDATIGLYNYIIDNLPSLIHQNVANLNLYSQFRDLPERSVDEDQFSLACEGKSKKGSQLRASPERSEYELKNINNIKKENIDKKQNTKMIEKKKELCKKMIGFQYISQINELILGRTLKLIRIEDAKYYFAGVLLIINFSNN